MLTWFAARTVDLDAGIDGSAPWAAVSLEAERRRSRLRGEQDRADFAAARVGAAVCVAALTGRDPAGIAFTQVCRRCGGPHGAPAVDGLPSIAVSWSHSRGWIAAAATDRWTEQVGVGVDVEVKPEGAGEPPWSVLNAHDGREVRSLTETWSRFLATWVGTEAIIKARRLDLSAVSRIDGRSAWETTVRPHRIRPGVYAAVHALPQPVRALSVTDLVGLGAGPSVDRRTMSAARTDPSEARRPPHVTG